jgi:bifunctional aspartokinase / homoserine dehydrogenase 1
MSDTNLLLLGVGAIGRELLRQLATNHRASTRQIRVCGLIDRSGYVCDPAGLSWKHVMELRTLKEAGTSLARIDGGTACTPETSVATLTARLPRRRILVDATAADTQPLLETALQRGFDLVLANKLPLAGAQADFDRLHATATARKRRVAHEATVGAGLPVIDTLNKLIDAGDRVLSVEGCPSGTLGFLFGELGKGRRFSDALRDAIDAGYTEPDPRTDLSGVDVARKALILARVIGFRGDFDHVAVESLVPPDFEHLSRDEFVARLSELDGPWAHRVNAAADQGCVLRYRAHVTRRSISVGLARVPVGGSLATLSGTDNQFIFTTSRYHARPLVITGPGAGPAVTAAGVYNDVLALATRAPATRPGSRRADRRASPAARGSSTRGALSPE